MISVSSHCKSSDVTEKRLNRDALVCVDFAVDGRLDSHSGVDSALLHAEPVDQSGKRLGESEGAAPGAGVLGGENVLPRRTGPSIGSQIWVTGEYIMSVMGSSEVVRSGCSVVGMGTSAAATEARNCWVGALRLDATRLFNLNRGRGGEGARCMLSHPATGSGVLGCVESESRQRKPLGRDAAEECEAMLFESGVRTRGRCRLECCAGASLRSRALVRQ